MMFDRVLNSPLLQNIYKEHKNPLFLQKNLNFRCLAKRRKKRIQVLSHGSKIQSKLAAKI